MRKAAFTGTFDPITKGHEDLIRRSAAMFDQVIVAVAKSAKNTLFGLEDRVQFAKRSLADLPNVEVMPYEGLTAPFMAANGVSAIVRGVRSVKDFEYEFQMAQMNKHLANSVDTIMMAPAPEFSHVSSTLVREIAAFGGDVSAFVHPDINTVLLEKFS
ncbi:MAG: pantetheine-phosphate adenylyltransferase [Gammaproteobacteria bacterium]|jgi:pantetheine-phosphate adenylyltransferase